MPTLRINRTFPGESIQSILYRAAKSHHYEPYHALMMALGVRNDHVIDAANQASLTAAIGRKIVNKLQREQLTSHLRAHVAVCPICLLDAPYHREIWRSNYLTICPDHHVWLLSDCPNCKRTLYWARLDNETTCKCGCSLAFISRKIDLSRSQADLLEVIESALSRRSKYESVLMGARIPAFIKNSSPSGLLLFIAEVHALIEPLGTRPLENTGCRRDAFLRLGYFLANWDTRYERWALSTCKRLRAHQDRAVPCTGLKDRVRRWVNYLNSEPYLNDLLQRILEWFSAYGVIGFEDLTQSSSHTYPTIDPVHKDITLVELSRRSGHEIDRIRSRLLSLGIAIWASDSPDHDVVFVSEEEAFTEFVRRIVTSAFDRPCEASSYIYPEP